MTTSPNAVEDLIAAAIAAGAAGTWLLRGASAAALVWTDDGIKLPSLGLSKPHELIVIVRFEASDGGPAGVEFRTDAAPLATLAAHRQALRALVDGALAGLYPIDNGLLYCAHCGGGPADPAEPIQFEHTPECPIRRAREVLAASSRTTTPEEAGQQAARAMAIVAQARKTFGGKEG